MPNGPGPGPSWVGIGAQRSGTTWFTRLATEHPAVTLARGGRKELHYFDRFLHDPFTDDDAALYRRLFAARGGGEFTPAYLRLPWVPGLLERSCPEQLPLVVVLLRDPLTRIESAIRWRHGLDLSQDDDEVRRTQLATAHWESAITGSAYGSQLAQWRASVGEERMMVLQYEHVRAAPEQVLARFWARLGFGPVPLRRVDEPSSTSTDDGFTLPGAWRSWVVDRLRPEIERAVDEWSLDGSAWERWSAASA